MSLPSAVPPVPRSFRNMAHCFTRLHEDHTPTHAYKPTPTDQIITFPPDHFMLSLARATRQLYYPEYLPDPNRPLGLPGASAVDRPPGVAEAFGTLRYGRLAEILLYDIRRSQTLNGPSAVFVDGTVEEWLKARMAARDVVHVVNIPSNP